MLGGQFVHAQRDIYNWQMGANFGVLTGVDALEIPAEVNRYASRLHLQRSLGRAWQLGLHLGQVDYTTDDQGLTLTTLSMTYNWDNGALLKKRAFISPYHRLEVGYLARADYAEWVTTAQSYVIGLQNGVKFRLGDRLTANLGYGLFWELDEMQFENTFDRTLYNVWTLGVSLHFGQKKVRYRGPVFDASARFDQTNTRVFTPMAPVLSVPGLIPVTTSRQTVDSSSTALTTAGTKVRIDTVYHFSSDTIFALERDTEYINGAYGQQENEVSADEYNALLERLNYLESYVEALSRGDTLTMRNFAEEQKVQQAQPKESKEAASAQKESTKREAAQQPAAAQINYQTDPALIEILKRQEALMANQNEILTEISRQNPTINVEQARQPRISPQLAPTVMVPLNNPDKNNGDTDRIEALEQQVLVLQRMMVQQPAPAAITEQGPRVVLATPPVMFEETKSDSLLQQSLDNVRTETDKAADTNLAAERLQQKADSVAAVTQEGSPTPEVVVPPQAVVPPKEFSTYKMKVEYPAVMLFGLNKSTLEPGYNKLLDEMAEDLKNQAQMRATITGYTDRSGNVDYNRQLSNQRAAYVKVQLLSRGVSEQQLLLAGEGQSQAADKWSPSERRVEVELIQVPTR
jgi:outer membrane protein OmpA-like peptidoglycan-associated protein